MIRVLFWNLFIELINGLARSCGVPQAPETNSNEIQLKSSTKTFPELTKKQINLWSSAQVLIMFD